MPSPARAWEIGSWIIVAVWRSMHARCDNCPKGRIFHSHTEPLGNTTIEVYECDVCSSKYV